MYGTIIQSVAESSTAIHLIPIPCYRKVPLGGMIMSSFLFLPLARLPLPLPSPGSPVPA